MTRVFNSYVLQHKKLLIMVQNQPSTVYFIKLIAIVILSNYKY